MPVFSFGVVAFDDLNEISGDPVTNATTGTTGVFSVDAGATPITFQVDDDDSDFDDGFIDPPNNSTGGNNQLLDQPVSINGQTFAAGSQVELEFAITTTTGETFFYVRINGTNVGLTGDTLPQPGTTYTIDSSADGQDTPYDGLACFTAGTMIETADGPRPVESLLPGDRVRTMDNGMQKLRWIGQQALSAFQLRAAPHLAPIRINAGALGNREALEVSPQHRILMTGWRAELYFGAPEVLVPAKALVNGKTIVALPPDRPARYVHLLFDRHEIVFSHGLATESFHPGEMGLRDVDQKREVEVLFPDLGPMNEGYGRTAYPVVKTREARGIFGWFSH
ncbi:Hint domain-containing protein [Thalassococcus sp. S3]|uniref:Hint domain-containing protein n=1 Tax=Thalassococcus sp. S3 TaxID=2017482 RepID=UPI0013EED354|nr:Hint domain-containing protein [Thalassococcus sp. S3]